jgi:hypothetical protein
MVNGALKLRLTAAGLRARNGARKAAWTQDVSGALMKTARSVGLAHGAVAEKALSCGS